MIQKYFLICCLFVLAFTTRALAHVVLSEDDMQNMSTHRALSLFCMREVEDRTIQTRLYQHVATWGSREEITTLFTCIPFSETETVQFYSEFPLYTVYSLLRTGAVTTPPLRTILFNRLLQEGSENYYIWLLEHAALIGEEAAQAITKISPSNAMALIKKDYFKDPSILAALRDKILTEGNEEQNTWLITYRPLTVDELSLALTKLTPRGALSILEKDKIREATKLAVLRHKVLTEGDATQTIWLIKYRTLTKAELDLTWAKVKDAPEHLLEIVNQPNLPHHFLSRAVTRLRKDKGIPGAFEICINFSYQDDHACTIVANALLKVGAYRHPVLTQIADALAAHNITKFREILTAYTSPNLANSLPTPADALSHPFAPPAGEKNEPNFHQNMAAYYAKTSPVLQTCLRQTMPYTSVATTSLSRPQLPHTDYTLTHEGDHVKLTTSLYFTYKGNATNRQEALARIAACKDPIRAFFARYGINLDITFFMDSGALDNRQARMATNLWDTYKRADSGNWISHRSGDRTLTQDQTCSIAAHELGHRLGLIDLYIEEDRCPEQAIGPKDSLMHSSWVGLNKSRLYPFEVEELLSPLCQITWDPPTDHRLVTMPQNELITFFLTHTFENKTTLSQATQHLSLGRFFIECIRNSITNLATYFYHRIRAYLWPTPTV